jgi:hypothetical protein
MPTWRGWLLLVFLLAALAAAAGWGIYPFLALNRPVESEVLLVEGWVSDRVMKVAAAEFKQRGYRKIFVTGGPLSRNGWQSGRETFAEQGKEALVHYGVDRGSIEAVPSAEVLRDRTYAEALAFGRWLKDRGLALRSVQVLTEGAHGRRSRLLFQRALGSGVTVGVLSVPGGEYDPERWWHSSAGMREVLGEALVYGYACLLFRPAGP